MSDTPRTDKLFDMVSDREQPDGGRWGDTPSKWSYEAILDLTDFCRTLERELAAIKEKPVPEYCEARHVGNTNGGTDWWCPKCYAIRLTRCCRELPSLPREAK